MGKFFFALMAAACLLAACGCRSAMTDEQRRAKTEAALGSFATKLADEGAMSDERVFQALETYLERNKFIFGAAYASPPDKSGPEQTAKVLYVYRQEGRLLRDFRPAYAFAKAATAAWYTAPLKSGKAEWSAPYLDLDGAGAQVEMVTYSLPFHTYGRLVVAKGRQQGNVKFDGSSELRFIVTSDLLAEDKEPAK